MPYFADVNPAEAGAAYHFSRALVENCRADDKETPRSNLSLPCSVYDSNHTLTPLHPEVINSVLLNNPGSSDPIHHDSDTGLSLIGAPSQTPTLFSQGRLASSPRFNASTFAMNTTCVLVQNCMPPDSQYNSSFTCGPDFFRPASRTWFGLSPWEDQSDLSNSESWQNLNIWAVHASYPSFYVEPDT